MGTVKVSVIMPVYNTDRYLNEAIDSIINQTLSDIEIILINDGSTDNSYRIIQEYAQKDKRIKVFTQENRGLSRTRNRGIDSASGEYIYYMDSDDHLDLDTLELCYNKCVEEQLDFVFFSAENIYEDERDKNWLSYERTDKLEQKVYTGLEIFNILINNHLFRSPVSLNVINTEFIKKNDLYFYPNIIHEDQLYSALMYILASRVSFIDRTFFKRRIRANSIMTNKFTWKNMDGYLCVTNELIKFAKQENSQVQSSIHAFLTQMLNAVIWNAQALPIRERIKLFFISIKKYKKYIHSKSLMILLFKPMISNKAKSK